MTIARSYLLICTETTFSALPLPPQSGKAESPSPKPPQTGPLFVCVRHFNWIAGVGCAKDWQRKRNTPRSDLCTVSHERYCFWPGFFFFFFFLNNTHVEHTTIIICTGRAFLKRFLCLCVGLFLVVVFVCFVCVAGFCSLIFLTVVVIQ